MLKKIKMLKKMLFFPILITPISMTTSCVFFEHKTAPSPQEYFNFLYSSNLQEFIDNNPKDLGTYSWFEDMTLFLKGNSEYSNIHELNKMLIIGLKNNHEKIINSIDYERNIIKLVFDHNVYYRADDIDEKIRNEFNTELNISYVALEPAWYILSLEMEFSFSQ